MKCAAPKGCRSQVDCRCIVPAMPTIAKSLNRFHLSGPHYAVGNGNGGPCIRWDQMTMFLECFHPAGHPHNRHLPSPAVARIPTPPLPPVEDTNARALKSRAVISRASAKKATGSR